MTMSTAAYLRVSTGQQSIDQQDDAIAAAGITPDRVFTDTASHHAVGHDNSVRMRRSWSH
jgi:DNA invertase Pin-like site-specific DNA recombinase